MNRKRLRIIAAILTLTVMLTIFTACASKENAPAESMLAFTDALGREVVLERKPERVAALLGSFADVWLLSGGSVCATVKNAWDEFELELPDAINIGGVHSPNLELLLSADPDFVIASASAPSNVEIQEVLEAAGIKVAYFDVDNFEDYLAMLKICTDITGRKDLYKQNGLAVQKRIESIKAEFAGSKIPDDERTVLVLRAHSGSVKAKGGEGTILGETLADLGCINIADSDTSLLENLSVESVIRYEPYRIFAVAMGNDIDKAMDNLNRMIGENPAWGTLDAIAEGRFYIMDRKLFNNKPNARWSESYEILSEILLGK